MRIFLLGMPYSGRTTVAKELCQNDDYQYVDGSSWVKATFRDQKKGEHIQKYQEEYHEYLTSRIKANPWFCIDNILDTIKAYEGKKSVFIIDGIMSPKDFVNLFDINEDIVIFLNRTDNIEEFKDSESIAVSVMRDYCFWMSAAGLLPRERWLEYNFKIPGEASEFVKKLGSKNSVFIARSIERATSHIKEVVAELVSPPSPQS